MKIYLFNPETGVYLGEDFADKAPVKQGSYILPPDATTIAPPAVGRGQLLVFNSAAERWEVREDTRMQWRQRQNMAVRGLPDLHPPVC